MVRLACPRLAAAVLLFSSLGVAGRTAAQEVPPPSLRQAVDAATLQHAAPAPSLATAAARPRQQRPAGLVPLYVSFSALQALDTHSTSRAIGRGAVEANPVMKGLAGSEAGMLAVKAAGTAGVIFASEKMWRKNRKAAVIFMVAANSAMAWVVQNNYRAVR